MLITPKLSERLNLALEGVANVLGHPQAAIAIINERDAVMRILATRGFASDQAQARIEMPLIQVPRALESFTISITFDIARGR